jgi:hypothetical protein
MAIWEVLYRLTYRIGGNGIDFTTFLIGGHLHSNDEVARPLHINAALNSNSQRFYNEIARLLHTAE